MISSTPSRAADPAGRWATLRPVRPAPARRLATCRAPDRTAKAGLVPATRRQELAVAGEGTFEGYASLFGVADLARDVVMPGAFAASLGRRGAAGVRMLWQHDPGEPIGRWTSLVEDGRGLKVRGRLNLAVQRAREVHALLREGAVDGLSIGFRIDEARPDRGARVRRLDRIDLWEISIVTFPMLPGARVSGFEPQTSPARWTDDHAAASFRRAARTLFTSPTMRTRMTPTLTAPETKSADAAAAFDEFCRGFEAFKETNETRLGQIETRLSADVLTEEKLARIDAALDDAKRRLDRMTIEGRRPRLGEPAPGAAEPAATEHKAAFDLYVRAGEAAGLKTLEAKALSAGSGPDGGYLVPATVERDVLRRLARVSPIRSIAGNRVISGGLYKRAFSVTGPAAGWVGETAPRPQTDAPTLAEMSFPAMELYAMPAATQTLLDDAVVDIEQWIAAEVETVFAEQEGAAFVTGDGVNKPKGFLAYDPVIQSSWTWGKLGFVTTGAAGAFPGTDPSDKLVDLVCSLKAGYRQNATFVMNRKVQSAIRKFKDASGSYLWQPPAAVGQPATLMQFPVVEAEDMPDIGANSSSVAFGDFRRGYLVVDRTGIRVLRDPFSAKPYVLFYTTKRVGGGVQDFDAIKLLKFA